ncbi:MAG: hypothetical protein KDA65_04485 [Planctomycetaceae bacterium]|nr:hypothetical protein [Planctomycetaceae bacterium]
MKQFVAIFALLTFHFTTSMTVADDAVQLQYRITQKEPVIYKVRIDMEIEANVAGVGPTSKSYSEFLECKLTPLETTGETTTVEVLFSDPRKAKLDLDANGNTIQRSNNSTPLKIKIWPTGLVPDKDGVKSDNKQEDQKQPPAPAPPLQPFPGPTGDMAVVWIFPEFKKDPVQVGDRWEQTTATETSQGESEEKLNDPWKVVYTFAGLEDREGQQVARLEEQLQGSFSMQDKSGPNNTSVETKVADSKGEVFLDPQTGLIVQSNVRYQMNTQQTQEVSVKDLPGPLTVNTEAVVKFHVEVKRADGLETE